MVTRSKHTVLAEYEAKIAAPERKVGQLTTSEENAAPAPGERQRELLDHQRPEGCSIRRGCKVVELPRSTFYYRPASQNEAITECRLVELIGDIQDDLPGYGYRRVAPGTPAPRTFGQPHKIRIEGI